MSFREINAKQYEIVRWGYIYNTVSVIRYTTWEKYSNKQAFNMNQKLYILSFAIVAICLIQRGKW